MKNRLFITLLIFINLSFAQNKYNFHQFVNEGGDYFTAPLDWEGRDFLFLGIAAGATIGAMQFDNDIKEYTQRNRPESSPIPILAGRYYGEPIVATLLSSYLIIQGNSTGNRVNKKMGFEIAQSVFYAFATTQLLKFVLGRERPAKTDNNTSFTGLKLLDNDFWSMPSGHTTTAFALSTILFENTDSDILKVLSFAPALLTAYSRVYENRHWVSDVVLGGIIGFATAKFFVKKHDGKEFQELVTPIPIYSISIPLH